MLERRLQTIFDEALSSASLTVLFFDEVDSLCRARSSSEDESTRRVKNVLLVQLDRAAARRDVIILARSNLTPPPLAHPALLLLYFCGLFFSLSLWMVLLTC